MSNSLSQIILCQHRSTIWTRLPTTPLCISNIPHHFFFPGKKKKALSYQKLMSQYKLTSFFIFFFNFILSCKSLILISFDTGFLKSFTDDKVLPLTQQN